MFCSLVHVLVKTKLMPSMVGKSIFKLETLSFQVFIKYFKFYEFVFFICYLTDFFFRFPILRVSHFGFHGDGTHCPETGAVYKYTILCKIFKSSIQPLFQWYIVFWRWQFSHLGKLENQHRHNQVYSNRYISFLQNSLTSLHMKKKWSMSSVWSQYEHTGEVLNFISNNFLLQFMIMLIVLCWNYCNFVYRKQM